VEDPDRNVVQLQDEVAQLDNSIADPRKGERDAHGGSEVNKRTIGRRHQPQRPFFDRKIGSGRSGRKISDGKTERGADGALQGASEAASHDSAWYIYISIHCFSDALHGLWAGVPALLTGPIISRCPAVSPSICARIA
jgi:hypothetical protein